MKKSLIKPITFILFTLVCIQANAVPASPYPVKIIQPDGTTLSVVLKGDEFYHYQTTEDGYLVVKDKSGIYNYASADAAKKITDTGIKAKNKELRDENEKVFLTKIKRNTSFVDNNKQMRMKQAAASGTNTAVSGINSPSKFPIAGSPKSLVILANFSDNVFSVTTPQTAFTNLLNEPGYSVNSGTGSARDYFKDNTMGTFSPEFDVVGPYTLPQPISYYGANNSSGNDTNPAQMVADACTLANNAGVDFTQYDTDNDGYVDNVFIYYAGYNEAEWGDKNTIWPHRWTINPTAQYGIGGNYSGSVASITFDGKRVFDYACTSELKGKADTNMCGIGTFCHEFGHVLGLDDLYVTDEGKQHTLSSWDVMDYGPYLNNGRTPPAYSAFERFSLDLLTPIFINTPKNLVLEPLTSSNKAYLITQGSTFDIKNYKNTTDYFLLENRQRTGWDKYLPGHGMLITRIKYNANAWYYNEVNNDANAMGVDIMEADGIATDASLSGDPFPGTSGVNVYIPELQSGIALSNKPISEITEMTNQIITFKFMGGSTPPLVNTQNASFTAFTTIQGTPSESQTFAVDGKNLVFDLKLAFSSGTHYEMKKDTDPETEWKKSITLTPIDSIVSKTNIMVRYNPTEPSYMNVHNDNIEISTLFAVTQKHAVTGKSSRPVYVKTPVGLSAKDVSYKGFAANWGSVYDATGYYITVYNVSTDGVVDTLLSNKWVTSNTDTLYNLISDRDYYFKVRASDKNTLYGYENITSFSEPLRVHTLAYTSNKVLRVVSANGNVKVFVPTKNSTVNVFNTIGQKIVSITAASDIVDISGLPRGHVYIVQSDSYRAKILVK
ncbi:MAG: family metalloprotease domain protein [Bacteroidetes bacterium]|nr:family metalloprotease domain protein [Bacteroidota bacterium]